MRSPLKKIIIVFLCSVCFSCSKDYLEEQTPVEFVQEKIKEEKFYKKWNFNEEEYDIKNVIKEEESKSISNTTNELLYRRGGAVTGKKIYVHYMPWFQTKSIDGFWGQHWTMMNQDPDQTDENGKRQIASHYYPLIGPYSTNDEDLQEYHLLLMKFSGIDGVIFDWYGIRDVWDFDLIKRGTDNFISQLETSRMKFAIMYEDRVVNEQARGLTDLQLNQAIADIDHINKKYFRNRNYIKVNGRNLLMIFGPNYIDDSSDWEKILASVQNQSEVLTLWNSREILGTDICSGEYAWIDKKHLQTLKGYYNYEANFNDEIIGGVAYPRFNDFYKEGGWRDVNEGEWELEGNGTNTFEESFVESENRNTNFIQIATWNDFGEGTIIEPTKEFGFQHLEKLQSFTGVNYRKEDLRIPFYIYKLKKQFPDDYAVQFLTKRAWYYAMEGQLKRSKFLLSLLFFYYGDEFIS
ncbi:glycoside hydrolase family 71/99-like protein [Tenacibaculum sp. ZS6-P6]|uniref:glycoside hydrolase family 71/99-like protein n=1 Tax=Tenacibaculum sp. ZS6-P6 TaxID=3447503 RepID=UPI003F9CE185